MKTLHDCLVPSSGDPAFLHVLLLIIVTEMVLGAHPAMKLLPSQKVLRHIDNRSIERDILQLNKKPFPVGCQIIQIILNQIKPVLIFRRLKFAPRVLELGAGDCRCGKKASLLDSFSIPLEVDEMLHSGLLNERSCQNDCKKRRRTHGDGYSVRIRCKKNIPNVLRLYLFESF